MKQNHSLPHCEDYDSSICPANCEHGQLTQSLAYHKELLYYPIKWKHAREFTDCKLSCADDCVACEVRY